MTNELPAKAIRARVIAEHLRAARTPDRLVVCLTCGNAAAALRAEGLNVAEVGAHGPVVPNEWLSVHAVAQLWPGAFDATSGHLSVPLMVEVGQGLRGYMAGASLRVDDYLLVPSGSGETAVALALAFPGFRFTAVYDDRNPATQFNEEAPLNRLVRALCDVRHLRADTPTALAAVGGGGSAQ